MQSNSDAATPVQIKKKVQKTMEIRLQQQRRASLTQPLECNLQAPGCKSQKNYAGNS